MEARAQARYVRVTPQKARRVVDLIRGMNATDAQAVLAFAPQAASEPIGKVLASAVANAANNHAMDARSLVVAEAFVDEGPTMKRIRPRAQGRAYRIRKRSSHITVIVSDGRAAVAHDDGDVAAALADPVGTALGARTDPLHRRALIDERLGHDERAGIHRMVVRRVGDGTREHLADRLARRLRREREDGLGVRGVHAADQVDDAARLLGRDAHVARLGPGFHVFPLALVSGERLAPLRLPVVLDVALEGAGRRELAELVPDHVLRDEDGHVLAPVVHGDRVSEHGRDDHRAT